ncbi:MAG: GNAT family N-acetyltransferase [Candidatus Thorarchaeota archaeon]|nr:GNAT family N-acetyltransferase [Candidatus Thorarchaeota archaeon]
MQDDAPVSKRTNLLSRLFGRKTYRFVGSGYSLPEETVTIVEYSEEHAGSIAVHLFPGTSPEVIIGQRRELLAPGQEEVYSVCALEEDRVVGVCTGVRGRWYGSRHRIELVQVVVHDDYHRRGIARNMMAKIAKHFKAQGVEIVQVSVERRNTDAWEAYKRLGFKQIGILRRGLKVDDNYNDEIMLAADIDAIIGE